MTDSRYAPEREDEQALSSATEELLPDPGFASSLFDDPAEQAPCEGGAISEETLFPTDPIFFSDKAAAEPEPTEEPAAEVSEPEPAEEPVEEASEPEPTEPPSVSFEPLEDSGSLFDPIAASPEAEAILDESDSDESLGIFRVPESEQGATLTTAAFYAASELPLATDQGEGGAETRTVAPEESGASAKKPKKRSRGARPVRELTKEELLSRRQQAEHRIGGARLRFCLAAFLSLLLAVVEIFPTFGLYVTRPLGIFRIAGAEALLDLQLVLLIALCAYRCVTLGFRSVLTGRLRAEGIVALLLLLYVAYDVALYALGIRQPLLCGLVLAVSLSATVWVEMSESRVEAGILALLCESNGISAALSTDGGGRLCVTRLEHADGFDEHIGDHNENAHYRFLVLLGVLAVGTLGLIAAVVVDGTLNPFGAALAAALLSLPCGALLARRIYLSAMQEWLLVRKTALIGESTAYSAASHAVFSIEDSEAFDAKELKIKIINVFGDFRLDEAVRLVAGVYRPIGGALAEVLNGMCEEAGGPYPLSLVEVGDRGAVASDGTRTVAVGTRAFMSQNSIVFPSDADEESLFLGERLTVLYCAVDGRVVARMFVEYTLSSGFENLADQLSRLGTSIELRTADPCLSEEYLLRLSSLPRGVLSLCRVGVTELLSEKRTRAESCFFTTDRPRSLVGAWLAFRRYFSARRRGELLVLLQLLLGGLLLGVSVFCFGAPLVPISFVALYHLAAIFVAVGGSRAFCRGLLADAPDDSDTEPKGPEL